MNELSLQTSTREEMVDITALVQNAVIESGVVNGLAICFVPHTTAGVTINENADPDVTRDMLHKLHRLIPQEDGYLHAEGNSDAHIKTSLIGSSEQILIEQGQLVLGHWQGIQFCEFDGPRKRRIIVRIVSFA